MDVRGHYRVKFYPLMKIINFYAIPVSYLFAYFLLFIFMYYDVKKYSFLILDFKKVSIPLILLFLFLLLEVINLYFIIDTYYLLIDVIQFTFLAISCLLYYFWFISR